MEEVKVMVADESHIKYIDTILTTIAEAAKKDILSKTNRQDTQNSINNTKSTN